MNEITEISLEDVCAFKGTLKPETMSRMVQAPSSTHEYLNTALMENFNSSLCGAARVLQSAEFTPAQAVEVLYAAPAHREAVSGEIERAVRLVYGSEVGAPVKRSEWKVFTSSEDEVSAFIKQRNIEPLSEEALLSELGDTEEVDNVSDFLSEFFKGVEQPVYIGTRYQGIVEHIPTWLMQPDIIEDCGYDQILANPMKRMLTPEERKDSPSGGRGLAFASDTLDVVTIECDKLSEELQFGVIRYIARHLPLVAIVYSGGKSYHATFSTKDVPKSDIHDLRRVLVNLGGDGAVMSPAQLTRLGAVDRSDKGNNHQRVLWINGDARSEGVDKQKLSELLDKKAVPEKTPEYYYHGGKYYMLDSSKARYIGMGSEDLTRQLRSLGYSNRGEDGEMSEVDSIKTAIVRDNSVDAVGLLAGRSIGLMVDKVSGMRHLVTRKNNRVGAGDGDWSALRVMLEGLYAEQLPYFYAWLHRARRQLNEEQFMMGHALAIAGQKGGGKSLTAEKIIAPLLGAKAKAHRYLTGATEFNADLCGSELLILDDEGGSRSMADRKRMGNSLKESTAGSSSVSRHGKGFDAYTVSPLWRIVVCMNDDADAIGSFPPLGEGDCDSLGDKVLMLKCYSTELPFSKDENSYALMDKMIGDALPAFAAFLDSYEIPKEIKTGSCRFGFDEFHHPDLLGTLNQHSNPRTMLSATDWTLFSGQGAGYLLEGGSRDGRRYYDVKALEWGMTLLHRDANLPHKMKSTVEGELFGINAVLAGKCMKAMSEVSDGRVVQVAINGKRLWRIWEDLDVDLDDVPC